MMCQRIEELIHPLAGDPLDPVNRQTVQPTPLGPWNHLVGDLADQVVLEGVFPITTELRVRLSSDQVPLPQRFKELCDRLSGLSWLLAECQQAAQPEPPSDDCCALDDQALV